MCHRPDTSPCCLCRIFVRFGRHSGTWRNPKIRNSLRVREPEKGIEPLTCGLRNRCSTTELLWRCGPRNMRSRRRLASAFTAGFVEMHRSVRRDRGRARRIPLPVGMYEWPTRSPTLFGLRRLAGKRGLSFPVCAGSHVRPAPLHPKQTMLTINGQSNGRFCDGFSRRDFLRIGGLALGGLSLPQILRAEAVSGAAKAGRSHKAVIMIFLPGGPSHQDIFDLKMDAPSEIRGEFKPIGTNVPGIQITRASAEAREDDGPLHAHPLDERLRHAARCLPMPHRA